jgi:hypothetical protein
MTQMYRPRRVGLTRILFETAWFRLRHRRCGTILIAVPGLDARSLFCPRHGQGIAVAGENTGIIIERDPPDPAGFASGPPFARSHEESFPPGWFEGGPEEPSDG